MAKRNQYNRPDISHIDALTVNKLRVKENTQISGTLFVQDATAPEIRLKKSNPGARWRWRIEEETMHFSTGSNWIAAATGSAGAAHWAQASAFSSSFTWPKYSCPHAVGIYVKNSLGAGYISHVGLSSSVDAPLQTPVNDRTYFYGPLYATASAHTHPGNAGGSFRMSGSGQSVMFFPQGGIITSTGSFYTALTSSGETALYVETSEIPRTSTLVGPTGSITVAFYYSQWGPPES